MHPISSIRIVDTPEARMTSATDNLASIQPRLLSLDGLSIRYATSHRPDAPTVLMLSPWPESIYAYLPMWDILAARFSLVAVDLPGFGQSQGRPELMSPKAMGDFPVRFAAELGLDHPRRRRGHLPPSHRRFAEDLR
jgi:pimeloyl-ACP methyl ester carboxylesterase